ncbi:hypothetical protein [Rufibacter sp. DG15C]|uniref:hypothetical protein n=1 Tax=Rufibacter sp. DG15C TaxID=1379909 RepID=UPI0012F77148|nr:hypothetical protein [Rufibacter sp. DG15C]
MKSKVLAFINSLFVDEEAVGREKIIEYVSKGWIYKGYDKLLIGGLISLFEQLCSKGIPLENIQEISCIGRIPANAEGLIEYKQRISDNRFKGTPVIDFDVCQDYVLFKQLLLKDGSAFAFAYGSPADYMVGKVEIGVLWVVKLTQKIYPASIRGFIEFSASPIETLKAGNEIL